MLPYPASEDARACQQAIMRLRLPARFPLAHAAARGPAPPSEARISAKPPNDVRTSAGPPTNARTSARMPPDAELLPNNCLTNTSTGPSTDARTSIGPPTHARTFAGPPTDARTFAGPPTNALTFAELLLDVRLPPDHKLMLGLPLDYQLTPRHLPECRLTLNFY
ncbi:hypothetical protein MA16_Dca004971 [Dendrobium catenatum]|uniref:Uncharacterized protein n=1 Tax=Dendrobium catenatum TaxID=906689 RepID=A0A2I0WGI4_9ASPA|nr:hypothetical protein MA16_Dca004971 [Dendrobium catenatum]